MEDCFDSALSETAADNAGELARFYCQVFNAIPDILGILDVDRTVIQYNLAGYKFLNKGRDEIAGKKCYELIGRDTPCEVCASHEVIRTGKPSHIEKYVDELDIWFDVRAYPLFDNSGKLIRIIEHLRDITKRKKTQIALKDESTFRKAVIKSGTEGVCVCHNIPDYPFVRFTVWNDRMTDITGYTMEQINESGWYQTMYPDEEIRERAIKRTSEMRLGDDLLREEWVIRRADGEDRTILISTSVMDKIDSETHVIATMLDITDRKVAEKALQDREARISSIFRAAPVGIGLVSNRTIIDANRRLCEMTGYSREELIGQNAIMLYPTQEEYDRVGRDKYAQISRKGMGTVETRWKKKDGTIIDVLLSSAPLDPEDLIMGVTFTALDISDRKAAENNLRGALEEVQRLKNRLQAENIYLQEEIKQGQNLERIIGQSEALKTIFDRIKLGAGTDASVLIQGETGTGKELIARAIHEQSHRRDYPMIRVNCASIPRELFESEFFGHVKGAFTGAIRDRVGRFQLADGGTLFLDEVGEIPLELQSKLLRVLQEGEFERVGEDTTNRVNVRIIASTNRHLEQEIITGRFRQDLYFRLSVFPIEVPPLRDRPEDIALIAEHYLKRAYRRIGVPETPLSPENICRLQEYWWPGNVRELQNIIDRAVIISRDMPLRLDFPNIDKDIMYNRLQKDSTQSRKPDKVLTHDKLRQIEIDSIIEALEKTGWKVYGRKGAAALLEMKPSTLASRIKALGIKQPEE